MSAARRWVDGLGWQATETPTKEPVPFAPGWDQQRWEQLFQLETLLNEVTMIDHGTGVLDRLQRCIDLAEGLRGRGVSLPRFLMEMAVKPSATSPTP